MYHKPTKRKELIKRIAVYTSMIAAVTLTVTFVTFYMLGYRFNVNDGNLEQRAFLQFSSTPSGATVTVDGAVISAKTPNKTSVAAGEHTVIMWRDGYETWQKTINAKAGTLTWLNYALLVPKSLTVESVLTYDSVYTTLASPNGNSMLVQKLANTPSFELVDISSDTVASVTLTIPTSLYSESTTAGVSHTFQIQKWNDDGRYVLIKHTYGDQSEWLVLDTKDVSLTKNITKLFDLSVSSVDFASSGGDIFYALASGDIRKLDISKETISKPLISSVTSFNVYDDQEIITYIGVSSDGTNKQIVGLYRDGDDQSYTIKTLDEQSDSLHAVMTRYFNENYVAISNGKTVDILSGSYPDATSDTADSLKVVASFEAEQDVAELAFSPSGEYVFAKTGAYFASYDLEYQTIASTNIEGSGSSLSIAWLDDNYLWSDRDGKLTIREFDGSNAHTINSVTVGQDVTLTHNGRYLYSISKTDTGYQLQRVKMILS